MSLESEIPEGSGDPNVYHLIRRKSEELSQTSPIKVIAYFHDTSRTLAAAASELVPEAHSIHPRIAARIVSAAAKLLMDPNEYRKSVTARRQSDGRKTPMKLTSGGELLNKAIGARGKVPWSNEERTLFLSLLDKAEYLHPKNSTHPGKPNFDAIAKTLNETFHNNKEVRSAYSLPAIRRGFLKKDGTYSQLRKDVEWSPEEWAMLNELRRTEIHSSKKRRIKNIPDWQRIANLLNNKFHAESLANGTSVRNAQMCARRVRKFLYDQTAEESDNAFEN